MNALVSDAEERHVEWNVVVFVTSFHGSLTWVAELVPIGSGTNASGSGYDIINVRIEAVKDFSTLITLHISTTC
jgi:hypothetical protein